VKQNEALTFPAQTVQNWEAAAIKELEGAGSLEKLTVEKSRLSVKPYYTAEDVAAINLAPLAASRNSYGGARHWANMPKVIVVDAKQANEQALFHLQNGADGVCFELTNSVESERLLDKIELPYCLINFLANSQHVPFLNSFHAFAEKKYKKEAISGNIFWKEDLDFKLIENFKDWNSFQSCGVISSSQPNAVDEMAETLHKGVDHVEKQKENGVSTEQAFQQVAFFISIENDFFLEIAKLKALRTCWSNIEKAYKIQNTKAVFIHATSPAWINAAYQPHGNLIKETYSALAAILGGCDGLTIEPEDDNNITMNRMARNTSSVLHEESFLSQVADPLAGSYFIESLTKQIAEKAWEKFQGLEME
jgi:methylmalonyl-CoA mutase